MKINKKQKTRINLGQISHPWQSNDYKLFQESFFSPVRNAHEMPALETHIETIEL